MKEVTRRGFITQASVVGAAAAVVGISSMPSSASAAQTTNSSPTHATASDLAIRGSAPEDVVIHIRDAKTSEVALIAGHEEYVYHDAKLVSSVLSKFNKSTKE